MQQREGKMKRITIEIIDENTVGVDVSGCVTMHDDEDHYLDGVYLTGEFEDLIIDEVFQELGFNYICDGVNRYKVFDEWNQEISNFRVNDKADSDEFFVALFKEIGYKLVIM